MLKKRKVKIKKELKQKQILEIGQRVVVPNYGGGVILGIEKFVLVGEEKRIYGVKLDNGDTRQFTEKYLT